jgi:hypothetical protein
MISINMKQIFETLLTPFGKIGGGLLVVLLLIFASGCSDVLDTPNGNEVDAQNHYHTFNDADKAIMGIYGKLMELADRVIVLNELRGDLMDFTANATYDQMDISNHTVSASNKYCDLTLFYEVISNCNDALANFNRMRDENKLTRADYDYRYADVMVIRCWVYLQLAIHFGDIPYITEPFASVSDLGDAHTLGYNEVLDKLIVCMSGLPTLEIATSGPLWAATAAQTDNINLKFFLLNKHMVYGDILLYSNRYKDAAEQYLKVITEAETKMLGSSTTRVYKLFGWGIPGGSQYFEICYSRFLEMDVNSYSNKWKEIFSRASADNMLADEVINMFTYESSFEPQYPLIELFANTGKGKYQLRPSQWALDGLWEKQVQRGNGVAYDGRGRESSFDYVNGQPVVLKYLYDYYPQSTDANSTIHLDYASIENMNFLRGKWFIYRAALLHLRYAEAANRAGYPDLALALLNSGIQSAYNWRRSDGTTRGNNVEGVQYSGYRPVSDEANSKPYPEPFYLDARNNGGTAFHTYARFSSPWQANFGVRRRAYVENVSKPDWVLNKNDSIQWVEEALLTEAALECGFEGYRWGDLLRIAMRKNEDKNEDKNDTGTVFLNEILAKKFRAAGRTAPVLTPQTWFLPRKN